MCHRETRVGQGPSIPPSPSLQSAPHRPCVHMLGWPLACRPCWGNAAPGVKKGGEGKDHIYPRAGMQAGEGAAITGLPLHAVSMEEQPWVGSWVLAGAAQPQEGPEVATPHERSGARSPPCGIPAARPGLLCHTHSQIQHVHRHRLLRQHLHCGVCIDRDGAAAHCEEWQWVRDCCGGQHGIGRCCLMPPQTKPDPRVDP